EESFLEYCYVKLRLISIAFPHLSPETMIAMIRKGFLDSEADTYIRERSSLPSFAVECKEFDEHLILYPRGTGNVNLRSRHSRAPSVPVPALTPHIAASLANPLPRLQLQQATPTTIQPSQPRRRNALDARASTIADRPNEEGRMTRSFINKYGK